MSKIAYIIRPITNGMYNDTYTVYYTNGTRRRYTINGAMNKKHFEFIQSATVEAFYSKWTGAHKHDIFRPAPEAIEEPEEVAAEEPAAEETDEEQNEEIDELIADEIEKEFNEQNTAKENTIFFQELVSARDYFIRSAAGYVTGTKYERDINGDFWGARQCEILMSNINRAVNNCNVSYKRLAEDFEHLAEMFAEISDKYDGNEDERTVSEIIYEYTRYFPELGATAMYR